MSIEQPTDANEEPGPADENAHRPLDGAPEVADKPEPEDAGPVPEHGSGIADKPGPPL